MEKIEVTHGVYWIGIPEVNLYVLCGCPANTVKLMMKKGLIIEKEIDGVTFETGPNAILLSEVIIQNGSFSNLAEFPFLQMFYRQGMIIPNHPNNTGMKPLLIGLEDQVEAQNQYVFRGNYGLCSIDEMMEAGVSEEFARDMMRLKLSFAFGKIRKTDELIENRIFDRDIVEIRDGVFIQRKGFNRYDFLYKGEFASIDLNLKGGEAYERPFQLEQHRLEREYFSVIHMGEGDGWDVNRPCMGSIVMFQGNIYLIDAGPGIMHSLTALGIGVNEIEGIFHTHAHDDHFAGLPTFLKSDHMIKYYSTPLVRASVMKKLAALMSWKNDMFERYFEVHDLNFDEWNNISGLEVMPVLSPHPVETNILFFRALWEGGYITYAHFADIISLRNLRGMIVEGDQSPGITREFFEKVKTEYLRPVNLKKLDVGGGPIHGRAEDFVTDASQKIMLSHTSSELTTTQKEIGSEAFFGMADVLVPSQQDYLLLLTRQYLKSYFPTTPSCELDVLLNCQRRTYNAGTVILRKGTAHENVCIVLSGKIDFIDAEKEIYYFLSAGALIGGISVVSEEPAKGTYRAASYVTILQISRDLYLEFIKRNNLFEEIVHIRNKRSFLQATRLFSEGVSSPIHNEIARLMELRSVGKNELIEDETAMLYLVDEGEVQIFCDRKLVDTVKRGQVFGEEKLLVSRASLLKARARKRSKIYAIAGDVLTQIPVIQWKLQEIFKKRLTKFETFFDFRWLDEYSVNVAEIDKQHRAMFEEVSLLSAAIDRGDHGAVRESHFRLIDLLRHHMVYEESLMEQHEYKGYRHQREEHEQILSDIESFKGEDESRLLEVIKGWLLSHTLMEDRKYQTFFQKKGIT